MSRPWHPASSPVDNPPIPAGSHATAKPPPACHVILRAIREASGMSQAGWAAWLGYGRATIQRWEQGTTVPDANGQQAVARFCQEKGHFRLYTSGPLSGVTLTSELLDQFFAETRLVLGNTPDRRPPTPTLVPLPLRESPRRGNLREPLSTFVGRQRELDEVRRRLVEARLVSLVGIGGIGKTRLARAACATLGAGYPGGIWMVELAAVSDSTQVPRALAAALDVHEVTGQPLLATLTEHLATKRVLLILDNCEHVWADCTALTIALLESCPEVRILATSRQAFGIVGERVWRVPPLSVPDLASLHACPTERLADRVRQSDAARLFVERAAAVEPNFELTPANALAIAQVCQQVDGIPLALELASARVAVLALPQIVSRLDDRLRFLTSINSTPPQRHQTLRATLDWSHALLTDSEQIVFRRLSVFYGGFTLVAAETVCVRQPTTAETSALRLESDEVFDILAQLVDKSLVSVDLRAEEARYHLLETMRQYAAERLHEAGETAAVQERHARWHQGLVQKAEPHLRGPEQSAWLARLDQDLENIRAALRWSLTNPSHTELGVQIASGLRIYWYARGLPKEGQCWLEAGLASASLLADSLRATALDTAAALAHNQGEYGVARAHLEQSIRVWRGLDDQRGLASALNTLGILSKDQGDQAESVALFEEALGLSRDLGDRQREAIILMNLAALAGDNNQAGRAEALLDQCLAIKRELGDAGGIATALHNLGDVALHQAMYDRAEALLNESLAVSRQLGARHRVAQSLHALATIAVRQHQTSRAAVLLAESLALFQDLNSKLGVALCLEAWAELAQQHDDVILSARLLAATAAWRAANRSPVPPNDRADIDRLIASCRHSLGEASFASGWETGSRLQLDQAARLPQTAWL